MRWKLDRRTFVLFLIFIGYFLCYFDRMVISTTIPYIGKEFHLSKTLMGAVMSAFFIGYTVCQMPGGVLVDKFGPRKVMTIAIAVWSVFTGITGMVANVTQMIIARVIFGVGEAPYPAASMKSIALWFEPSRRAFATAVILSSNSLGPAVAPLFAVAIMAYWGWRAVFYCLVIPGIIMTVLIAIFVTDHPPRLQELEEAQKTGEAQPEEAHYSFWQVLQDPVVWKSTIMFSIFNIAGWGFKTWLPGYLVIARHLPMKTMGVEVSIVFAAGIVGYLFGGWLSDGPFRNNRKMPVVIFQFLTAVLLYLMYTVKSLDLLMLYQTLAGFFLTAALAAVWALPVSSVSKKITGRAIGIFNTGGQAAGLFSPIIIGYLVDVTGSFNAGFNFMIACLAISIVLALTLKTRISEFD